MNPLPVALVYIYRNFLKNTYPSVVIIFSVHVNISYKS